MTKLEIEYKEPVDFDEDVIEGGTFFLEQGELYVVIEGAKLQPIEDPAVRAMLSINHEEKHQYNLMNIGNGKAYFSHYMSKYELFNKIYSSEKFKLINSVKITIE